MIEAIDHIGIAVKDLEASLPLFQEIFQPTDIHRETVAEQGVHIASFKVGEVLLELTAPTSDDCPIAKFIAKKGEGIHHIAFRSDGIGADLQRLSDAGIRLVNEEPVDGAHDMKVAFMHPKSTNGVLMELCQSALS